MVCQFQKQQWRLTSSHDLANLSLVYFEPLSSPCPVPHVEEHPLLHHIWGFPHLLTDAIKIAYPGPAEGGCEHSGGGILLGEGVIYRA